MSKPNPFAGPLVSAVEARYNRLRRIPPAPYDLQVSKLREGFARSVINAVLSMDYHVDLSAIIICGEMWVIPRQISDLCDPGNGIYDEDDEWYIPPELYVDRETLAVELAEAKAAWDLERPKDPTFPRPIVMEHKPEDEPL